MYNIFALIGSRKFEATSYSWRKPVLHFGLNHQFTCWCEVEWGGGGEGLKKKDRVRGLTGSKSPGWSQESAKGRAEIDRWHGDIGSDIWSPQSTSLVLLPLTLSRDHPLVNSDFPALDPQGSTREQKDDLSRYRRHASRPTVSIPKGSI